MGDEDMSAVRRAVNDEISGIAWAVPPLTADEWWPFLCE